MKICPACNESFTDELNFCDVDGTRLTREGNAQDRNKWWSLIGAGLLVAAVVISAASIFLPKARVVPTVVNSGEPQPAAVPAVSSPQTAPSVAAAVTPTPEAEPESGSTDALAPELKPKNKSLANSNVGGLTPNPKAAALASEGGEKPPAASESKSNDASASKPETIQPVKSISDTKAVETTPKPAPAAVDPKKDHPTQPVNGKNAEKDQNGKKKNEDDKKKGGFLRVFKKIFGKD